MMGLSDILGFLGISFGNDENYDYEEEDDIFEEYDETVETFIANNGLDGGDVIEKPYYHNDDN